MSAEDNAQEALQIAIQVQSDFKYHTETCMSRYENLTSKLDSVERNTNARLKSIWSLIAWAGTTAFGIIIAILGFLLIQLYDRNESDKKMLSERFDVTFAQHTK